MGQLRSPMSLLAKCRKNWPIRKCIIQVAGPLRPGSQTAVTAQGSWNRMVHERVHFVGESVRSLSDLPTLHERNAGRSITNEQMRSGTLVTTDPFLQCMVVQTEHHQEPEVIDYQQLRSANWTCMRDRRLAESVASSQPVEKERKKDRVNDRRDEEVVRRQSRNSVDGNFFFQNPNLKLRDFSEINFFSHFEKNHHKRT